MFKESGGCLCLKSQGVVYVFLKVSELCNDILNVFIVRSCPEQGKKTVKYWCKIFLLKYILSFEYEKNCISKLSKLFLKRKTREGTVYAHQMLLSFKASVALTSRQTTVSVRQFSSNITRFFVGHCPMSEIEKYFLLQVLRIFIKISVEFVYLFIYL